MSRIKTYYSDSEINKNLYTYGKELMTTNYENYIGPYHTYITTGEIYSLAEYNSTSLQLIPYREISTAADTIYTTLKNINVKYKQPTYTPVVITSQDIKQGFVNRYFIKKNNEQQIFEINKLQFDEYTMQQIDNNIYTAIMIKWYITGAKEDIILNGTTVVGVITKNQKQIDGSRKNMPGIDLYLTNTLQYYTDNSYVIPTDINGLN